MELSKGTYFNVSPKQGERRKVFCTYSEQAHVLSNQTLISMRVNGWTETVGLLCKQSFVLSGG